MVVKLMLEPHVEPHFHKDSYGYRPGELLDAVAAFGFIPAGVSVRVVEVSSFRIVVESAGQAQASPPSA